MQPHTSSALGCLRAGALRTRARCLQTGATTALGRDLADHAGGAIARQIMCLSARACNTCNSLPSMASRCSLLEISAPRSDGASSPAPAARTTGACSAACQERRPKVRTLRPYSLCNHVAPQLETAATYRGLGVRSSASPFSILIVRPHMTGHLGSAARLGLSHGLGCTQVVRVPCCSSASLLTSFRAAQPTHVRSTSPHACINISPPLPLV